MNKKNLLVAFSMLFIFLFSSCSLISNLKSPIIEDPTREVKLTEADKNIESLDQKKSEKEKKKEMKRKSISQVFSSDIDDIWFFVKNPGGEKIDGDTKIKYALITGAGRVTRYNFSDLKFSDIDELEGDQLKDELLEAHKGGHASTYGVRRS